MFSQVEMIKFKNISPLQNKLRFKLIRNMESQGVLTHKQKQMDPYAELCMSHLNIPSLIFI